MKNLFSKPVGHFPKMVCYAPELQFDAFSKRICRSLRILRFLCYTSTQYRWFNLKTILMQISAFRAGSSRFAAKMGLAKPICSMPFIISALQKAILPALMRRMYFRAVPGFGSKALSPPVKNS